MRNNRKNKLKFSTVKNEKSGKTFRFAVAFLCFFVLFGGLSVLVLLRYYDFDLSSMVTPEQVSEDSSQTSAVPELEPVSGVDYFLLYCTSDSGDVLNFTAVLKADLNNLKLTVLALASSQEATVDGKAATLAEHLALGGAQRLTSAIESLCGVKIKHCVASKNVGFRKAVNVMGGLTVDVPQSIDWRTNELTVIIREGEQQMNGDTLLKYMLYNSARPGVQADIICKMLDSYIVPGNTDLAPTYFEKVVNHVETDISVLDFSAMLPPLRALAYGEGRQPSTAVISPEEIA